MKIISPPLISDSPGTPAVDRTDDRTAMPICARAAGGRVHPQLGFRSQACVGVVRPWRSACTERRNTSPASTLSVIARRVRLSESRPVQRHGLRRIACATALTGAVGAVGGVLGLSGLRAHAGGLDRREVAQRVVLSAHVPVSTARASISSARPTAPAPSRRRAARKQVSHRWPARRVRERRPLAASTDAAGAVSQAPPPAEASSPPAARPEAHSEFGFEQ